MNVGVELAEQMMASFSRTLERSRLSPIQAMSMMAEVLGDIYRQRYEKPVNGGCDCGWHPDTARDIEVLQKAFTAGCLAAHRQTLQFVPDARRPRVVLISWACRRAPKARSPRRNASSTRCNVLVVRKRSPRV